MFGAAALMFAACSSDEAVKVNKGEEIAFRANINWTRGHDMNIGNLDKFSATAINPSSNSTNPFFENAIFEKEGNTYVCKAAKYYWPETDALNFFAYAPVDDSQIDRVWRVHNWFLWCRKRKDPTTRQRQAMSVVLR